MHGNRDDCTDNQRPDDNSGPAGHKSRHSRYRTKLCRNFPLGTCRYGHNCTYLHIAPSTRSPPLLSPVPTAARSFFYPTTLSIPSAPVPVRSASAASQQRTAPSAPTRDARPPSGPGTGSGPGPLSQTHDGRTRPSRRDQPHASRRALLPRAHTPAGEYTASECPDGQASSPNSNFNFNFNLGRNQDRASASAARIQRWRRQESASPAAASEAEARCAPTAEAEARAFPPAPPATPVSVASPGARWKELGGNIGGGAGERYRWTGNGVLKWVNATGGCGLVSPPPQQQHQQQVPSMMARNAQAPKLFKHRNQFFKTKPCRFYAEPSGCIKGDRCNFIHEHPDEGRHASGLVAPAEAYSESEHEPELSGAESSVQDDPLSPLSPSTAATSEHVSEHADGKKNFYPVTWRVVGGGVMMSGKRQVCEAFMAGRCSEGADCRYAHPETSEPDYLASYPEPPPMYSPMSPMVSPVYYAYPVMYPTISPPQPFALPAMSSHMPSVAPFPAAAIPQSQHETAESGYTHTVLPSSMASPDIQPSGLPYPAYSPHRVVDGSTLVDQRQQYLYPEGGLYAETLFAARSMVRPVSTPPYAMHGSEAGVARLFPAEMP